MRYFLVLISVFIVSCSDSSQETKIVEKKVGASFEKRMLNLAKASQENIASDEMKSFIRNLDSMKETCHNTGFFHRVQVSYK